ncbi:MAG TPA: ATP-binding protein, partial [Porphyromonadaceae bacterium]|nr:ATP-binding protein [Porphyromonadaceae bacterium]
MKPLFDFRRLVKYVFMAVAIAIALVSLVFSNGLVRELAKEERNKIEIWAAATELLAKSDE